jgi:hypothetical protein
LDGHTWYRIRFSYFSSSVEQASVFTELKNCLPSQEILAKIRRIPNNHRQGDVISALDPEMAAQ